MYRLDALDVSGFSLDRLPYSIRVMLEAVLRGCDGFSVTPENVEQLATI